MGWAIAISGLAATMLDFPLPVTLWDVGSNFIGLWDHANMGIAVGISPLSSLLADIWSFPVCWPSSWISGAPAIFQMSTIENLILLIFLKKWCSTQSSITKVHTGMIFSTIPHGLSWRLSELADSHLCGLVGRYHEHLLVISNQMQTTLSFL